MKPETFKPLGIIAGTLAIGAIIGALATSSSIMTWLSLALGVFLYGFVPGYALLLHLELDSIERSIFAFPVGVMTVSLALYFLNLFGILLTRITVLAVIVLITAAAVIVHHKKPHRTTSSAE